MNNEKPKKNRGVVRRERGPRQRLAPDLEKLASGEEDRLRRPPRRPRLKDERAVALIPGVRNRDARTVFDAWLARLEEARGAHPKEPEATERLRAGLRELLRTRLWRGRSLTGFDVVAEQLLDLPADEARELAGDATPLTDEATAIWLRSEAALLEAGFDAHVRIVTRDGAERVEVDASVTDAPRVTDLLAKRLSQLRRDLTGE